MPALPSILTAPLRHPRRTLALATLCAFLAIVGISRTHPDPSLQAMFARDNPSAEALVRVLNDFGTVDDLLVMASLPSTANPSQADVDRLVAFGDRLAAQVARDPETSKLVDGVLFTPDADTRAYFERVLVPAAVYYLDDAAFAAAQQRLTRPQMVEQLRQDEAMLSQPGAAGAMGKALMRDPLRLREFLGTFIAKLEAQRPFRGRAGTDAFVSTDGRNLLVRVRGKRPPNDIDFCNALTARVAEATRRANTDGLELRYAGSYAIAATSAASLRHDMIESVVGSVLCLQVLFLVAYRGAFKLFALAFGPIALGVVMGFGAYSLWTTGLTPLTAVLGGILAGMAIDYSIQYLSFYASRRDAGDAPADAAAATTLGITPAAFAAWATSVVGFLAIGASSVKALRDFSLLGSLGLGGAFLCVVTLLPTLLMLTDRKDPSPHLRHANSLFRFTIEPLLIAIARKRRWWLVASAAVFVAAVGVLALSPGEILPLESDLTAMHPRPNAALEAQALIGKRFGFRDWLLVHLRADSPRELVALAHRVDARLNTDAARASGVTGSFGLASLLPDPLVAAQRQREVGPAMADRVVNDFTSAIADSAFNPEAPEIREYSTFLRILLTRDPPTMADLLARGDDGAYRFRRLTEVMLPRTSFDGKTNPTEAVTLVFLSGSTDERDARDRAVNGLRTALAGETGATLTGLSVISHDTERTVRRDLPRLCLVAVGVVLLYLIVHFRSAPDAILAMAPTAFSFAVLLAAMRLAGQRLNMVNLIAAPLLIGIDVDYGIFLVSLARVRQVRSETCDALRARIAPVCHAVITCAFATFIGFGSLAWTSVPAVRSLGFAVAVGIGACLACVLFFLVPLFFTLTRTRTAAEHDA